MEKKILKLQKKSNKIFAIFQKMIDRLIKHNEKLLKINAEALEELERQQKLITDSNNVMYNNIQQIKKLEQLIGKEDCCE